MTSAQAVKVWTGIIESAKLPTALLSAGGAIYLANEPCWTAVLGVKEAKARLGRGLDYCSLLGAACAIEVRWDEIRAQLDATGHAVIEAAGPSLDGWRIRLQRVALPSAEAVLVTHEWICRDGSPPH